MRVIGLLAGVGTLLWEAREAGLDVVGNFETRGPYHTGREYSWDLNFPDTPLLRQLNQLDPLDTTPKWYEADVALGHPPCGSHSTLGNSGARTDSMDDATRKKFFAERNADMGLLPLFVERVRALKVRSFALDNLAKILKTAAPPEWWRAMLPEYHLTFVVMRNWDYGTPQRRERLWVIGVRKPSKPFVFVEPKGRLPGPPTLLDALNGYGEQTPLGWEPWIDLPHIGHVHVQPNVMLTADYRTTIKGLRIRHASNLGLGFLSIPPSRPWPYTTDLGRLANKIGRLRPSADRHAPVVTGLPSIHHPYTGWPLTPRERARLMDWPDTFHLGNESTVYDRTAIMRLILFTGKAVPSGFPRYLIPQLMKHLKRRG